MATGMPQREPSARADRRSTLKVIVVDAPRHAAHYARIEESLADPTIMGNLLGATAIRKGWKYASIRRTEHGDFILWQGIPQAIHEVIVVCPAAAYINLLGFGSVFYRSRN